MSDVQYAVLHDLHLVRLGYQGVELDADLALAGSTHLVMVNLNIEAHLLHRRTHCRADIMQRVNGGHGEVAAFDSRSVTRVAVFKVEVRGPGGFLSVDRVAGATHVGIPFHVVKHKELGLGAEERGVSQTG